MSGPCSSYCRLDSHSCWKVPREHKIDPPIHTLKRRSIGDAVRVRTLTGNCHQLENRNNESTIARDVGFVLSLVV